MITPTNFVIVCVVYLGGISVFTIIASICKTEIKPKTHFGISQGIAGLIGLGTAVIMVLV